MRPNQDRMSVMLDGVGNWRMASRNFAQRRTFVGVISKPANSNLAKHELVRI